MELTFVKTLQGHEIEFVRLLYPLRYNLIVRVLNENPVKVLFEKNEEGVWSLSENENKTPVWISQVSDEVQKAIEANEEGCKVH